MQPRPAATIVVARAPGRRNGVEVVALKRSSASRFAPGFVVFPGGAVEDRDDALALEWFASRD